jgi:hypothetical protein
MQSSIIAVRVLSSFDLKLSLFKSLKLIITINHNPFVKGYEISSDLSQIRVFGFQVREAVFEDVSDRFW